MSRKCQICGVGPMAGRSIVRKGKAKKEGGVGKKTTRTNIRRFLPNLQKVKALVKGSSRTMTVFTRCIRSGKIRKA